MPTFRFFPMHHGRGELMPPDGAGFVFVRLLVFVELPLFRIVDGPGKRPSSHSAQSDG
jgi:hypothetical protein